MHTPFGDHLLESLRRQGLSQNEFARKVGTSSSNIAQVIHGKRAPPLEKSTQWMDVLQIGAKDRERFTELAHLAHCSPYIVERYLAMQAKLKSKN